MAHDAQSHVMDSPKFEFFTSLFDDEVALPLPGWDWPWGGHFQLSKFMVLELIAAILIIAIYIPLAKKVRTGALPRGRWWNCFESLLTFVRNEIAKPNLDPPPGYHDHGHGDHGHEHAHGDDHSQGHGHDHTHGDVVHDDQHAGLDDRPPIQDVKPYAPRSVADRYTPYLWTVFLFILFCNLLGMFPYMGSPTANVWVTGALALCSFLMMHGAAIVRMGPVRFVKSLWPHLEIDIPGFGIVLAFVISLLLCTLELFGTVIKSGVLAIRLFANMFAGHMVLATILMFIYTIGHTAGHFTALWGAVTLSSVLGVVALSLLELFVAFLQAYVFTFLTALFMGMSMYPQH